MTRSQLPIEAVGFDIDHTLAIDRRLERTVALELAGRGREHDIDLALASYRYGIHGFDDAFASIGIDPSALRALVLERAPQFVEPVPGARELLAELRRGGIPVAILSNGWSPLQETKAQLIGFEGPILVSDVLGARKPASEAFDHLRRRLNVAPQRIAYVGDDLVSDVLGALSAGMQALWFNPDAESYPQGSIQATATVAALGYVLEYVQGPLSQTANPPA